MEKIFGNDRSHHNGTSNFAIAYANGARFDIAKSSEGLTFQDDTFVANFNGAKAQYQVNGGYHYYHPGFDANKQLDNLVKGLDRVELEKRSLIAVDVEENNGLAKSITASRLKKFTKRLRAMYPVNPIAIYTSPYFWSIIGDDDPYWLNFALWEANTGVKVPTPIPPWNDNWAIWQFSHTGYGPAWGASSKEIDVNIMAQWCWDVLVQPETPPEPPEPPILERIEELIINGIKYTGKLTLEP
jgi:lysozyme